MITYVKGDLVTVGVEGQVDVLVHGCNCFCSHQRGIAKHFNTKFATGDPSIYRLEAQRFKGDINKLGQIEVRANIFEDRTLTVINAYTQYRYGPDKINVDYDATRLCMRKINHIYAGSRIGLPKIGCGLAGGDWMIVERIIKQELKDCTVTIVEWEGKKDRYEGDQA